MTKQYMILCVAGQSNAVGYDESRIPADYMDRFDTGRIFQLGFFGEDNLKVIPLGPCARSRGSGAGARSPITTGPSATGSAMPWSWTRGTASWAWSGARGNGTARTQPGTEQASTP